MPHTLEKQCPGSPDTVLFVHGFMGSPAQFDYLFDAVRQSGYSAASLLLPGHGSDGRAFARHGLKDWQRHLQAALPPLCAGARRVFIVSHSMGGLLALRACILPQSPIAGLFLIAPPAKLRCFGLGSLRVGLRILFAPAGDEIRCAYAAASGVGHTPPYVYPLWLRPLTGLLRLMALTRRILPLVNVPVALVHSMRDETVSFKSADILYGALGSANKKRITLTESWHAWYSEGDKALIRHELLRFLSSVSLYSQRT